jgi:glyoxylase-like metal-dependent hydrolase (beta-lactamase superfamily II)
MPKVTVLMHGASLGTDVGVIGFCSVILIEGERRILFDSAHVGRRTFLEAQLAKHGLTTGDIDAQVLSHAHWDHVQNCDLFSHAPMLLHRDELRYAHKPHRNDWATPAWTGAVLDTMTLEEVGEGHEVMPGCRVIELTGHSPGSIGLEVETDDGIAILTGDAVHNARVAQAGRSPLVFWNEEDAAASIKRVVDSGALVYPGHDHPFRLRDGGVDYSEQSEIKITGGPGMTLNTDPQPPGKPWVMPGAGELSRIAD